MAPKSEIDPKTAIAVANQMLEHIAGAGAGDPAAGTALCAILNGLTHKQTGAVALSLATMVSELRKALAQVSAKA
jgi:hypothetical protein